MIVLTISHIVFIATVNLEILPVESSSLNFTIQPLDHVVAVGKPLLLNCQAQYSGSGTVHLSWKNNDNWLLGRTNMPWTQLANHSLYYSSIPAQSIGTFICGATIIGTNQIIYSRTAHVEAAYINSQFFAPPTNTTQRLGQEARFHCVTNESLPYASIYWEKDGRYFAQGVQFHIPSTKFTSSALSVKNVTFASAGWYRCVATNPLLPNQPQRSKKAYLTVLPVLDQPHFGVYPTNMIVAENIPSIMSCLILGVPSPLIAWTQNGQPVHNVSDRYILSNGSLYFASPVNRSYAGQYVCSGTNSVGSVSSPAVLFRIAYFDFSFIENPSNRTAVVGSAVSIKCISPSSFPVQVAIHWYHNYQMISPDAAATVSIDSSGTIIFKSIKKSDEGMYFCDGTNSYLQVTRTSLQAYVTVQVPPTIQVNPKDTNVTNGNSLTLNCQATGFPQPLVTWQKDGRPVDTSRVTLLSNGTLFISSTVLQDAGKFSCKASNIAGFDTHSADVVIYVPPSLISGPENATKTVGDSVSFRCSFYGIPLPHVHWFYSSGGSAVPLTQTADYSISPGYLQIRQIEKRDEGKYICQAVNIAGSTESSAYLNVKVPASLHSEPMNVTVNESSSASFQCNASGDPKPIVTWFRGGVQLSAGGRVVIREDSLTVVNTEASDTGQYSCNVSNGLSFHVGVAYLIVQVAPNITLFNVPRMIRSGTNATLLCAAMGVPQPRVTWRSKGEMLTRVQHATNIATFVIINVAQANSGIYTCFASNAAGISSKHANLTVQVVPSSPIIIAAIPQSPTVIQLSWKPGFDGYSTITGYKLEMKRLNDIYIVLAENLLLTSYTVRNLDPYTTYTFRISARNAIGLSPGEIATNTTLQDAPSTPRNVTTRPWNETVIGVMWTIPAKPNGQITSYEIQYNVVGSNNFDSKVLSANRLQGLTAFIDGLKVFTRYQLKIRAATLEGLWGNFSLIVEAVTAESAPSVAPQGIQLLALSAYSILINWKLIPPHLANGNLRLYVIKVKATGPYRFSHSKNFSVGHTTNNITVSGLFAWTKYNVSIQAVTVQPGPESPWKQVRTLEAAPGPPSNVTLVSDSKHSITVFITPPVPAERNGVILGYSVFYRKSNLLPEAGYLSVNTTDSSVRLRNLTVFTEYSVKVVAFTSAGHGHQSQEKRTLTQEGIPGTVANIRATAVAHDTITVSWSPPSKPNGQIVEYRIIYNSTDGTSSGSKTTSGDKNVTRIQNLIANTTYVISVTAKTSKGFGKGTTDRARTHPAITVKTASDTTRREDSTSVGVVPGGTEKTTGGMDETRLIFIIVGVALIVLFITLVAAYFIVKRWKDGKGIPYKSAARKRNFKNPAFELERPRLDVHEEPSVADTNYSSDSFDSDFDTSVASPHSTSSPVNENQQYANPVDSTGLRSSKRSPVASIPNKRVSVDSQGSQPYSTVEELGGGFSSFAPLPPVEFRSSPIEERDTDSDKQENLTVTVTSPGSRKSFTNQLFKAVQNAKDVDLGDGGTRYEGFPEQDISGMVNRGYDSDEELNKYLGKSGVKSGSSDGLNNSPKNVEELYSKVDKSKKKAFPKKNASSSIDTASHQLSKKGPASLKEEQPDKSEKTFRKVSPDQEGKQAPEQRGELSHDPVVVYDERTNFETKVTPEVSENNAVDNQDARSVGESTLSSGTIVSDLNSCETPTLLTNLSHEPLLEAVQDLPPPSPYTLKNKKLSVGSADSFYDEPYSSLEEIDAGITPRNSFSTPGTSESTTDHRASTEEKLKIPSVIPYNYKTSFPNQTYGVMDKAEDEAVVLEVKEIENVPSAEEADNTIQNFNEVLNSLLPNEPESTPANLSGNPRTFARSNNMDSTVLMF